MTKIGKAVWRWMKFEHSCSNAYLGRWRLALAHSLSCCVFSKMNDGEWSPALLAYSLECSLRTTDLLLQINIQKGKICAEIYARFSLSANRQNITNYAWKVSQNKNNRKMGSRKASRQWLHGGNFLNVRTRKF